LGLRLAGAHAPQKVTKALYLIECALEEAFALRSDVIVRVPALKVKSRSILCLICGSTVPVIAPAGLIAQ
jgi:hypothetical protein